MSEIVVGVDGSAHGRAAIAWALGEARVRHCGLLLVHVCDVSSFGLWTTTRTLRQGVRELAQPVVDEAIEFASTLDPTVPVRGRLILGSPSRALTTASAGAPLLVLGRQGRSSLAEHLLGSVSRFLMAHALCPVVVAPTHSLDPQRRTVDRIVVAIGDRPTSLQTVDFALAEAALRSVPVRLVHAWQPPSWPRPPEFDESPVPELEMAKARNRIITALSIKLGGLTARQLAPVVRAGRPDLVIERFCRDSDLVVLGQHRQAKYLPALLGSVVSDIVHGADFAVAVIGEPVQVRQAEQVPVAASGEPDVVAAPALA